MSGYRRSGDRRSLGPRWPSIDRALASNPSKAVLRVQLAIVHELTAWTRARNAIRADRIIDIAGDDERAVRRSLRLDNGGIR